MKQTRRVWICYFSTPARSGCYNSHTLPIRILNRKGFSVVAGLLGSRCMANLGRVVGLSHSAVSQVYLPPTHEQLTHVRLSHFHKAWSRISGDRHDRILRRCTPFEFLDGQAPTENCPFDSALNLIPWPSELEAWQTNLSSNITRCILFCVL